MSDFNARHIRRTVLQMAYAGATVHVACAFSLADILAVLYRRHLRYPDNDPDGPGRDYMVLSKGHGVMAQYACLHEKGWLAPDALANYYGDGTLLKGLSDAHVPGCEVTSGSLGHGLSVGVGMALAAKLGDTGQRCYVLLGDGEMNEGPIWEAMLFAAHRKLDNLLVIVDENGLQAMGKTSEVMDLGSLRAKFESFNFEAVDVDGHDEAALDAAFTALENKRDGRPKALVARTVKGKGVSFMEHQNLWHYTRLDAATFAAAMSELEPV
ncbi:transketolase [Janthinobacterium sp. CG_23.3]|uniref:transketolase n=1 Tax=Janthinobacterium sp. CG_23.3 TaxID=3349634 RepID=UPI0038D37A42